MHDACAMCIGLCQNRNSFSQIQTQEQQQQKPSSWGLLYAVMLLGPCLAARFFSSAARRFSLGRVAMHTAPSAVPNEAGPKVTPSLTSFRRSGLLPGCRRRMENWTAALVAGALQLLLAQLFLRRHDGLLAKCKWPFKPLFTRCLKLDSRLIPALVHHSHRRHSGAQRHWDVRRSARSA